MYHPSTVLLYLSDHYTTLYIHRTFSFYGMIFISVQLQPSNKTNISRRLAPERSKTFLGKQEKNWQRLDKRLRILRFVIAFSCLFIHLFIYYFSLTIISCYTNKYSITHLLSSHVVRPVHHSFTAISRAVRAVLYSFDYQLYNIHHRLFCITYLLVSHVVRPVHQLADRLHHDNRSR